MTHQVFTNLSSIADRYDGFIVDLWGVIHDGINLYPGVDEAIDRLMQAGKRVVLLSNAPRQIASIAGRLIEYGLAPDRYTALMTSGEEAWQCLNKRTDPWYQNLGDRVYHIGSVRDDGMRVGINPPDCLRWGSSNRSIGLAIGAKGRPIASTFWRRSALLQDENIACKIGRRVGRPRTRAVFVA